MPELVLQLTRAGFLALLWIFVLVALRVVRSDLYAAAGLRPLVRRPVDGRAGRGRAAPPADRHPRARWPAPGSPWTPRPILIGRADDSTLVLDDDYASTRHAGCPPQGDQWYVEDLGSTNGTYLDRS